MRKNSIKAASLAIATLFAASAVATTADARRVRVKEQVRVCDGGGHKARNGAIIGAVGGGLVGNAIGQGTGATLAGAGIGAVAGHEIGKSKARRNCHWETRWVYRNR